MIDVRLRGSTPRDLDALFELHRVVFRSHIEEIWGWDEEWQRSRFEQECAESDTSVVVVNEEDLGFLQVERDDQRLFLRSIALHPKLQGRGVGKRLVKRLQRRAKKAGVPLELVLFRTNARAQSLYEQLGFEAVGRTDAFIEMRWTPARDS